MKYEILKDQCKDHHGKTAGRTEGACGNDETNGAAEYRGYAASCDYAKIRNPEEAFDNAALGGCIRNSIVQKCQNQGTRTMPEEALDSLLREWEKQR